MTNQEIRVGGRTFADLTPDDPEVIGALRYDAWAVWACNGTDLVPEATDQCTVSMQCLAGVRPNRVLAGMLPVGDFVALLCGWTAN